MFFLLTLHYIPLTNKKLWIEGNRQTQNNYDSIFVLFHMSKLAEMSAQSKYKKEKIGKTGYSQGTSGF